MNKQVKLLVDFTVLYDVVNPRGTEQVAISIVKSVSKYIKSLIILVRQDQYEVAKKYFTEKNIKIFVEGHNFPFIYKVLFLFRQCIQYILPSKKSTKRFFCFLRRYKILDSLETSKADVQLNLSHCYNPIPNINVVTITHAFLSSYSDEESFAYLKNLQSSSAIVFAWPTPYSDFINAYPSLKSRCYRIPFFTQVSYCIINNKFEKPQAKIPNSFYFYPSVILPRKNHKFVIEALAYLRDIGINRHVVFTGGGAGDKSLEYDLLNLIQTHRMEEYVHFVGGVTTAAVAYLYKNCFACIFPSLSEAGVSTLVEGLLCAKTTLCVDTREARAHAKMFNVKLSYFSTDNVQSFASSMIDLESNYSSFQQSVTHAMIKVSRIDEDYVGKQYAEVCSYVAGHRDRPEWAPYLDI